MRFLALAILTIATMSAAGLARAQTYDPNYPVCLHVVDWGGSYEDCRYVTMAQCAMSASGVSATCMMNPFYGGDKTPAPARKRR